MAHSETRNKTAGLQELADEVESKHIELTAANEEYPLAEQRRIIRKIDFRLIFPLGLMLGASFLDRANIGNAAIAGMDEDLGLQKGTRYSLILLVFFFTYVAFQMPCMLVVPRVGPRMFLPGITLAWGIVIMCFGFVHSWKVMIALRLLLGVTEAGLFPGGVYAISQWYTRYEVHRRYSSFYVISLFGAAFSGLLATAFSQMKGFADYNAWRWIFIMEGLLTCTIAFIGFALLVNMPGDAHKAWKFLTRREAEFVMQSIERDRQGTSEHEAFQLGKFFRPAWDPKIWGFSFIYMCMCAVVYAIAFFMPIILEQRLKFDVITAQGLSTPPYIFACVEMFIEGWVGDRYHIRSPFVFYNSLQALVGLCILAWTSNSSVQYFAMFLVAGGTHSNLPTIIAWQANNIRGRWKHSFCSASIIGSGGVGGIIGSLIFRSQDAPRYLPGLYACIVCCALTIAISAVMVFYFSRTNRRAVRGEVIIEGLQDFHYTI